MAELEAIYYPFSRCEESTRRRLLSRYARIHFREPFELRLTPLDQAPTLDGAVETLQAEDRIVRGHRFDGRLDAVLKKRIDADLADPVWRRIFHNGLVLDDRFRRSLGRPLNPALFSDLFKDQALDVDYVTGLLWGVSPENTMAAYGRMVVTTSASLWHIARLAHEHRLAAVTDSRVHHALFDRALAREKDALRHA